MTSRQRNWQRYARKGTTTARGYGREHQRERERRLRAYRPGDICAHGGEPMWWWPLSIAQRFLHLPHTTDRTGYLPGLSCQYHNCGEGATRGNRSRAPAQRWAVARRW